MQPLALAWRRVRAPLGAVALAVCCVACAAPRAPVAANAPTTARPLAYDPLAAAPTGGSSVPTTICFFSRIASRAWWAILLTIQINENLNASQTANSSSEKKTSMTATLPKITGLLGAGMNGLNLNAAGTTPSTAPAKRRRAARFTGTITVTVIEVLANGNLVVAGEKQIGIRQNSEVLRSAASSIRRSSSPAT
jgi:flagellar L-ring protein FlgH